MANELGSLLQQLRPYFNTVPKAKTAKFVKLIVDEFAEIPDTVQEQIRVVKDAIQWCREEKRTFLRHRLETRLSALFYENKEYQNALTLIARLMREIRKLDDKPLMLEVQLTESRVQEALRNLPKAKAALTTARTNANAVYCPPKLQAALDLQSGILSADEKDFRTAFSYFYEAFEAYATEKKHDLALRSLKYMLMSRIMNNQPEDVEGLLVNKHALDYAGRHLDAMRDVSKAYQQRSLSMFEQALNEYDIELKGDPVVFTHLSNLYNTLLEQNLLRLIEPFSRVQISHVASLIGLPELQVEAKLSQMILDKQFYGTLDQGMGCLVVFEDPATEETYPAALETIVHLNKVVDNLATRAAKLHA